jgi:hypothetical protein
VCASGTDPRPLTTYDPLALPRTEIGPVGLGDKSKPSDERVVSVDARELEGKCPSRFVPGAG